MVTTATGVYGAEYQTEGDDVSERLLKQGCEEDIVLVRATKQHLNTIIKIDQCFATLVQNLRNALKNDISNKDLDIRKLEETFVKPEEEAYQDLFGGRSRGVLKGSPQRKGLVSQWSENADRSLWLTSDLNAGKGSAIGNLHSDFESIRLYPEFEGTTIKLIEAIIMSHTGELEKSSDSSLEKLSQKMVDDNNCEVDDDRCQVFDFAQNVIKLTNMILNGKENLKLHDVMTLCNKEYSYSNCRHSRLLKRPPFFSKEKKLLCCFSGIAILTVSAAVIFRS